MSEQRKKEEPLTCPWCGGVFGVHDETVEIYGEKYHLKCAAEDSDVELRLTAIIGARDHLRECIEELEKDKAALSARIEAAERDALRIEWLAKNKVATSYTNYVVQLICDGNYISAYHSTPATGQALVHPSRTAALRAAIDSEMEKGI